MELYYLNKFKKFHFFLIQYVLTNYLLVQKIFKPLFNLYNIFFKLNKIINYF